MQSQNRFATDERSLPASGAAFKCSVTKNHSAEFMAEARGFLCVFGVTETLSEFEKFLLLALLGLNSVLHEFRLSSSNGAMFDTEVLVLNGLWPVDSKLGG